MFVDSHCHLDFPELSADLPAVLDAMAANRVTHALCISVNLPALPKVLQIAADHANLYASAGVHPDYEDTPEPSVEELLALAARPKVVAIGETGLDYHRLPGEELKKEDASKLSALLQNEVPAQIEGAIQDGAYKSAQADIFQQQLDLLSAREPAQQGLCALLNRLVDGYIEIFDEAPLPVVVADRAYGRLLDLVASLDLQADADRRLADINRVAACNLLH